MGTGRRRAPTPRGDGGASLAELLVAMTIFTVLLSLFGVAVTSMTRSSVRVQGEVEASAEVRRTFNLLDRQLRYAAEVNAPARVGQDWYVELRTDARAPGATARTCTQWRYVAAAGRLESREWTDGGVPPSSWRVSASFVRNDPTTQPPFRMVTTGGSVIRQQLEVALHVGRTAGTVAESSSTFVARNSTPDSATNKGGTVCDATARRP